MTYQECFVKNTLHLSTCYTVSKSSRISLVVPHLMCTAACRMWGCPFLSAVDKALPKRAPIAQWSGYKTGLVSDIFALC